MERIRNRTKIQKDSKYHKTRGQHVVGKSCHRDTCGPLCAKGLPWHAVEENSWANRMESCRTCSTCRRWKVLKEVLIRPYHGKQWEIDGNYDMNYWCCPRPRPPIFHLALRGLHTASAKFASGGISAAQRTLAPVLNDDCRNHVVCLIHSNTISCLLSIIIVIHIMIFLSCLLEKDKRNKHRILKNKY